MFLIWLQKLVVLICHEISMFANTQVSYSWSTFSHLVWYIKYVRYCCLLQTLILICSVRWMLFSTSNINIFTACWQCHNGLVTNKKPWIYWHLLHFIYIYIYDCPSCIVWCCVRIVAENDLFNNRLFPLISFLVWFIDMLRVFSCQ